MEVRMILQLFDQDSSTLTYIVADATTREAAIIDPVLGQLSRDLGEIERHGFTLRWILDTHVHADHETGANALKSVTGASSAVGAACESAGHDRMLVDGDIIDIGSTKIAVIATPGHTPGSMSFLVQDNVQDNIQGNVFTGDALLIEGCGRTDFQNGSSDDLFHSVTQRLFTLPVATVVWPGHDYRGRASSTIGHEKRHNPRFAGKDRDAFREIMAGLHLAPPKHLAKAVPANRSGGALHAGEPVLPMIQPAQFVLQFDPKLDALVDLRDSADTQCEPFENAVCLSTTDIPKMRAIASNARTLYVLCRSGRRSLVATEALVKAGLTNVCNVTGGVLALSASRATMNQGAAAHD
jgi:glyoxylase-like metal-dependent hydrolase (beta-lactamase superfamily II)/rhodanese-related sulfurtransferase